MPGAKKSSKSSLSRATKKPATRPANRSKAASKAAPKSTAKAVSKRPKLVAETPRRPRRLRAPRYEAFRLKKRIKHPIRVISAWKIAKKSRQLLFKHWKVIGGIVLVYGILNMVLVRGLSGGADVRQLTQAFNNFFHGTWGHLASGFTIFALLVSSTTSTSGASNAGTYQTLLVLAASLALVWAYRQLQAGKKIRIRDAYYRGMYPIIPLILVLLVIALQLLPVAAGGWLFSQVLQNGIAATAVERFLWGLLFASLAILSIYMLCSSLFALYIATLPDMTPIKALRSARGLVRYRRWVVVRKLLFLPLWLLVVGSLIMLPFILLVPIAAQWVFFVLSMVALAAIQAYMYTLYRELLNDKNPS